MGRRIKAVDILAVKNGKRIAFEIETGKSDAAAVFRLVQKLENARYLHTHVTAFDKQQVLPDVWYD